MKGSPKVVSVAIISLFFFALFVSPIQSRKLATDEEVYETWLVVRKVIKVIVATLFVRALLGVLHLVVVIIYVIYRRYRRMNGKKNLQHNHEALGPSRYSYSDIARMTDNFKEKLGQGGFGSVYKGILHDGQPVAIKMLDNSKSNVEEFINEVTTIGRIHHVNVVQLIGFCFEGLRYALVYEFIPNGPLEKYVFSNDGKSQMITWEKLYEIVLGVAHGIEYLHRECNMRKLQFDIKPNNILLDGNFNPKISNFGLAKLCPNDHRAVSTSAGGTTGYMAPELFATNFEGISYKSNVYSFGMLLLEIAGRSKNFNRRVEHSSQVHFLTWVYDRIAQEGDMEISNGTRTDGDIARKMAIVGLWCIQTNPDSRPSINKVVEMLEGKNELLEMPPRPLLDFPEQQPIEDLSLTEKVALLRRPNID
ncbi:rust resistance kinase Lr10-like [Magnolia sinica]|uniref:rust resistance kinase Lr10-like n=1 Tax=Magnolia sinica TaxID=86752 RepID=UPI00265AF13F|nr:rust resistance kinase Lr10-like [Magnolia sinica]